jgi:Fe2+ transport system protein FeoA
MKCTKALLKLLWMEAKAKLAAMGTLTNAQLKVLKGKLVWISL